MHKVMMVLAAICLTACATAPAAKNNTAKNEAKEPAWVANPRAAYSEAQFVSASGYGVDLDAAKKDALGSLIAVFGQNVKGETTVSTKYTEAVKSGKIQVAETSDIDRAVNSSFALESVVGAEIKDTWFDGKKTYYAVAVMDKAKAALTYANLIDSNEGTIAKLVDIPEADRSTLDAYARYDLAATVADANGRFLNALSVLSPGQAAAKRGTVSNGDTLRVQCLKISQNIPIAVVVAGDRDGRIAAAFASVISGAGFKSGGQESRYVINASMSTSEVVLKNNDNKFVRYVVDAKLTDTKTSAVLLPYNVNGREGHSTIPEAENRAYRAAEQKIKEDYTAAFTGYLSQLTK